MGTLIPASSSQNEDARTSLIWVGAAEGNAILPRHGACGDAQTDEPRPSGVLRITSAFESNGIVITDVKSSTYYASIAFASKGLHRTLDARPSDAIPSRAGCPIYATQDVLNRRTAMHLDAWINKLDANNTEISTGVSPIPIRILSQG